MVIFLVAESVCPVVTETETVWPANAAGIVAASRTLNSTDLALFSATNSVSASLA
jgi:hypothetical protein